jgi:DNA-binding response OmpR family regulator
VSCPIVLVVDDDADIREILVEVLTFNGLEVITATDGSEALRRLERDPLPSLIVLDWMMPGCDGVSFRVHQLDDQRLAGIPVIMLTAHHSGPDHCVMGELGIDCIPKPIDIHDLLDLVNRRLA